MNKWQKIPYTGEGKEPPYWLEMKQNRLGVVYRIRYRANNCKIERKLFGSFKNWKDAYKQAESIIAKIRFQDEKRSKSDSFVLSADLCNEITEMKKTNAIGTYKKTEIYYRLHIIPFLEKHCPYATELSNAVWMKYKHVYRSKYPNRPLFEHWKYFSQLFTLAKARGLIEESELDFNEKKDDSRKLGQVIPDKEFQLFLKNANADWKDRAAVQMLTGQRPGVIRLLKKEYVNFETSIISIPKEVSKNRRAYSFKIPKMAKEILGRRLENNSSYFFPGISKDEPTDKQLNSWHRAWVRAGIEKGYTPHDIRHTYLTRLVNTPGTNLPVLCYNCDLSIKLLMSTYAHINADDTEQIADLSDKASKKIFGDAL